jgi:hypothetical protein
MEVNPNSTTTNYQQVTVDVPEERIAEFHAFFARFLTGRAGRGRRGRHGRPHHGTHGRRCAERRESTEGAQVTGQPTETTEV